MDTQKDSPQSNQGLLVNVDRSNPKGVAVSVTPVLIDSESSDSPVPVSENEMLLDMMYGISTLIKRIEDSNPDSKGKIKSAVLEGIITLYNEEGLEKENEEFKRDSRASIKSEEPKDDGKESPGGNPTYQDW